jgi:hypothetical protein
MNTTNWKEAPRWAHYKATDQNGRQYWYEHKPACGPYGVWHHVIVGQYQFVDIDHVNKDWTQSLEENPL